VPIQLDADAFNFKEWTGNRLRVRHLTEMVRIAQRELGLPVDGKCGPKTRAALEAQTSPASTGPRTSRAMTTLAELKALYPQVPDISLAAVEIALALRGRGEEGANNAGSFLTEIGGRQGAEWCALLAGHPFRVAHQLAGLEPPTWTFRTAGVAEPGALRLVQQASAVGGQRFTDPEDALPGDLVLWKRTGGHHVAIVWHPLLGGLVATVEGNVGRFPALVRDLRHDVSKEPHFVCFARPWRPT